MTQTIVRFRGHEGDSYLQSAGGSVVPDHGRLLLSGGFCLVVGGVLSEAMSFTAQGPQAVVTKGIGADYDLILSSLVYFRWTHSVRLTDTADPRAPWLEYSQAWLLQEAGTGDALVALDQVAVSLVGDAATPRAGFMAYPRNGSVALEELVAPAHPQSPARRGFFILPLGGGHAVSLGSVSQPISLSQAVALELTFQGFRCEFWFKLGAAANVPSTFTARSVQPDGILLLSGLGADGGLRMATSPGDRHWGDVVLPISELESVGGALKVSAGKFVPQDVWLARTKDGASVANATGMLTPSDRLELMFGLALSGEVSSLPVVRLGYRNPSLGVGAKRPRDRHYGLRVAGLSSRAGGPATLDATFACFELSGSNANPDLHLLAGDPPTGPIVKGEVSIVTPKLVPGASIATRHLDIPVGDLGLAVDAREHPTASAIRINTKLTNDQVVLVSPTLVSAPMGITSGGGKLAEVDGGQYAKWALSIQDGNDELALTFAGDILVSPADWPARFRTADPTASYSMIDHPGAGLIIDPPQSPQMRLAGAPAPATGFTFKKDKDGKDQVVYSAFVAMLAYLGARRLADGDWDFLDTMKTAVELTNLDKAEQDKFVKSQTTKGLQVVYFDADAGQYGGLHKFIEDNLLRAKNTNPLKYYWPFTMGLSIVLRDRTSGKVLYADDIAKGRKTGPTKAHSGIAFDMSAEAAFDPQWFGWSNTSGDWSAIAGVDDALWPRYNKKPGARLDPTVDGWRGILLRDMPLEFPVPDAVLKAVPWAAKIIDAINKTLMLDYAYQDESGITWKGSISGLPTDGQKIEFASWDGVFEAYLLGALVMGAANKMLSAEASIRFVLPKITRKGSNPPEPLKIEGVFGLDLEGPNPLYRIDIQDKNGTPIETVDVPGFDKIALTRITTDLRTAQIEMSLTASEALASALPFLSGKAQSAVLAFNLQGAPALKFELAMPAEAHTNLFGRWPFTAQSMSIDWAGSSVTFRISGRLNIGSANFSSIGADVLVTLSGGKLSFDLKINELGVSLSLGSTTVSGKLHWGRPQGDTSHELAKLSEVKDRDLWGSLTVDDDGFMGKNQIVFRSGNHAEINFWVASLVNSGADGISLGIGRLKNPGLLLAHHADLSDKSLAAVALNPSGEFLAKLRPKDDPFDWLAGWTPSASIGTMVAASGFFEIDDVMVASPVADPNEPGGETKHADKLSGVMYIDTGVVRVDGYAKLLGMKELHFGIAVDFPNRKLLVSIQTDPIAFGKYTFNPGQLAIGFGFGHSSYLDIRLGWPPLLASGQDRDWSKALSFHADDLPLPVNTGWGGLMAVIDSTSITVGVAFRCGWTKQSGDVSGGSGGGFDIGYAVGGLVQVRYTFNSTETLLAVASFPATPLIETRDYGDSLLADFAASASEALARLESSGDLQLLGELFGDIWGSAWLKFMGVTLAAIELKAYARYRICGSLQKGITDCRASCGFSVTVTILCVTYHTEARYDLVLKSGSCDLLTGTAQQLQSAVVAISNGRRSRPVIEALGAEA